MNGDLMQREISEQPPMLTRNATIYAHHLNSILKDEKPEMILLAARGSSDHAALYVRYLIEIHLAIPAVLAAPSVLTRYGTNVKYPRCLAIGISQSGAAPDVAEVLESIGIDHPTLAITNTPGSHLTEAANATLLLEAGPEKSVAATKTFTASMLAVYQLVRALGANLPDPTANLPTDEFSATSRSQADQDAKTVAKDSPVFVLGRGYDFATASEAALKLMECALIPARAYSSADFEHGPKALAGPGCVVIAFDVDTVSLRNQGATVIDAPGLPDSIPEELRPIWQSIYAQWLALACARIKDLDPDAPQFLEKVTRTT